MIDGAIPEDSRIDEKEREKFTKYQNLKIEVNIRTLGKEGNSSAGGDRNPVSNTQRSRKTSENLKA